MTDEPRGDEWAGDPAVAGTRGLAEATHELNNFLGRIIGLAEMAMDEIGDSPSACADLDTLISTAEQAAVLVGRLDGSTGATNGRRGSFDLQRTIEAALRAAPAELELLHTPTISRDGLPVAADADLVQRALDALLRDAHRRNASRVEVRSRPLPSRNQAELAVGHDAPGAVDATLAGAATGECGGRLEVEAASGTTIVRLFLPLAD